jgi:hypothetical protein
MIDVFCIGAWRWNIETCWSLFKKGRERSMRENNGEDKPNWGTLHTYMEKSQLLYTNKNVWKIKKKVGDAAKIYLFSKSEGWTEYPELKLEKCC